MANNSSGGITIPIPAALRLTTDFSHPQNAQALPAGVAAAAMLCPGPIQIDAGSPGANGQAIMGEAGGSNGSSGYIGFNYKANIAAGGPVTPIRGAVIDGFAGVIPGADIYIDPATTADGSLVWNGAYTGGITQTAPSSNVSGGSGTVPSGRRIGAGWGPTKIRFD